MEVDRGLGVAVFLTSAVGAGRPGLAGLPVLGCGGGFLALAAAVVLVLTWLLLSVLRGRSLFSLMTVKLVGLPSILLPGSATLVLCPFRPRILPPPCTWRPRLLCATASSEVAAGVASVLGVATSVIVLPDESWKPLWRFFGFFTFPAPPAGVK